MKGVQPCAELGSSVSMNFLVLSQPTTGARAPPAENHSVLSLSSLGRQVLGFGDHPDAGFRAIRTRDDAAEIGRADADGRGGRLLSVELRLRRNQHQGQPKGR